MTNHNLETKVAGYVRSYLQASRSKEPWEDEQLRDVCGGLAWLLDALLRTDERWNPYHWIDAITPGTAERVSSQELTVQGLAIWGDRGNTKEWWEPFSVTLQISESSDRLVGYQIMFGDARLGLGKVPYNAHPRGWNWSPPENWLFAFARKNSA